MKMSHLFRIQLKACEKVTSIMDVVVDPGTMDFDTTHNYSFTIKLTLAEKVRIINIPNQNLVRLGG